MTPLEVYTSPVPLLFISRSHRRRTYLCTGCIPKIPAWSIAHYFVVKLEPEVSDYQVSGRTCVKCFKPVFSPAQLDEVFL